MTSPAGIPIVTVEHLRRLATAKPESLFRDADTLVLSDEGITIVPFRIVSDTLAGRTQFVHRLLLHRAELAESGVQTGRRPKTFDGGSLDDRLAEIAAGLNEVLAEADDAAGDSKT